jgi:hypothetical protein
MRFAGVTGPLTGLNQELSSCPVIPRAPRRCNCQDDARTQRGPPHRLFCVFLVFGCQGTERAANTSLVRMPEHIGFFLITIADQRSEKILRFENQVIDFTRKT